MAARESVAMQPPLPAEIIPLEVIAGSLGKGSVRLLVGGEVDSSSSHVLERSIRRQELSGLTELIIDLDRTTFIDASGLRVLVRAACRAGRGGWRLRIENARGLVRRVFDITEMDAMIEHWQMSGLPDLDQAPTYQPASG